MNQTARKVNIDDLDDFNNIDGSQGDNDSNGDGNNSLEQAKILDSYQEAIKQLKKSKEADLDSAESFTQSVAKSEAVANIGNDYEAIDDKEISDELNIADDLSAEYDALPDHELNSKQRADKQRRKDQQMLAAKRNRSAKESIINSLNKQNIAEQQQRQSQKQSEQQMQQSQRQQQQQQTQQAQRQQQQQTQQSQRQQQQQTQQRESAKQSQQQQQAQKNSQQSQRQSQQSVRESANRATQQQQAQRQQQNAMRQQQQVRNATEAARRAADSARRASDSARRAADSARIAFLQQRNANNNARSIATQAVQNPMRLANDVAQIAAREANRVSTSQQRAAQISELVKRELSTQRQLQSPITINNINNGINNGVMQTAATNPAIKNPNIVSNLNPAAGLGVPPASIVQMQQNPQYKAAQNAKINDSLVQNANKPGGCKACGDGPCKCHLNVSSKVDSLQNILNKGVKDTNKPNNLSKLGCDCKVCPGCLGQENKNVVRDVQGKDAVAKALLSKLGPAVIDSMNPPFAKQQKSVALVA